MLGEKLTTETPRHGEKQVPSLSSGQALRFAQDDNSCLLRDSVSPWWVLLIAILAFLLLGASSDTGSATRFNDLGHKLMCTCGCGQVLLECNHVGCQSSDRMRHELQARMDAGDGDNAILQWFVSKYGNTVLAAPTGHGFNRVAWIMPFAAFGFGIALCVFVVRAWNRRAKPVAAGSGVVLPTAKLDEMRRRAREDTAI